MPIDNKLIDNLLKDYKTPEEILGDNGLLKQLTKAVLERAMQAELTEHLGHEKNRAPADREAAGAGGAGNIRNGHRPKTVLTDAAGEVAVRVPRDRAGSFEPVIVRKRQRRLSDVDAVVISLYAKG